MNESLVTQLVEFFKANYGIELCSAESLMQMETDTLEMLMRLGREVVVHALAEAGTGYRGPRIEKGDLEYRFEGNREKVLHGLFGEVRYKRAYYVSVDGTQTWFPLDEMLGIQKKHTPACQYFLATFTAREPYEDSLGHFHQIFRPDEVQLISMRKALDMDYELGERLEHKRQQEIQEQFEQDKPPATEREIEGTMVVSIDATKVRVKGEERIDTEGRRRYETEFRDAKIAAVSALGWDDKQKHACCTDSSYVSGIEHADEFFPRIWVEMQRRCSDLSKSRLVFLADGANWIWDRVGELAHERSTCILDFYHAIEHLSDLCKKLFGEATEPYQQYYSKWQTMFWESQVEAVIDELRHMREASPWRANRDAIQGQINYFQENKTRMDYKAYREMGLPIGSGTVESSCKHVIAKRLKQSGMIWAPSGAKGMLQIRSSLKSHRFKQDFKTVLPGTPGESELLKAA